MRINDKQFIKTEQYDRATEGKKTARADAKTAASVSAQAGVATDSVELSSRVRDVADIKTQLQDSPDMRESLVADLREQIKSGTYNVSSHDIASGIVRRAEDGIF
jgi:flagellar biosynthesis anti-sigma factor FlgM